MQTDIKEHVARWDAGDIKKHLGAEIVLFAENVVGSPLSVEALTYLLVDMLGGTQILLNRVMRDLIISKFEMDEARNLCVLLGVTAVTAQQTIRTANFHNDAQNIDILLRWFGFSVEKPASLEGSVKAIASHDLALHQLTAYQLLRKELENPSSTTLIQLPFASGKLRLVIAALMDLFRSESEARNIIWVAPNALLADDALEEFRTTWAQIGSREITILRAYGPLFKTLPESPINSVIVADISSLADKEKLLESLGKTTRVVIFADAEQAAHPYGEKLIDSLAKNGEFSLVGISPLSGDSLKASSFADNIKKRFINSSISFKDVQQREAYEATRAFSPFALEYKILERDYPQTDEDGIEFSSEYIENISNDALRNKEILGLLKEQADERGCVLFIGATAKQARLFAGVLGLRGVKSIAATSENSQLEREIIITNFSENNFKILCLDSFLPSFAKQISVKTIMMAATTLSSSFLYALVGRALTLCSASNELKVIVLGDKGNVPRAQASFDPSWNKFEL